MASAVVPEVDLAVQMYINAGGTITPETSFGFDPLAGDENRMRRRENHLVQSVGSYPDIFNNIISGDGSLMEAAILLFFNTTVHLAT